MISKLSRKNGLRAGYVLYATIDNPNKTEHSNLEAPFYFASSVVKVSCAGLQSGNAINHAKINGVNTTLTLNTKSDGAPDVSGSNVGTITVTNLGNARQDGTLIFMAALLPQADVSNRTISVNQDKWPATSNFISGGIIKGSSISTVTQLNGPYKTVAGHTGVRLWDGGPYWATTNIGAESPTDRGLYFMWGYIQGYKWDGIKFVDPETGAQMPGGGFCKENCTKFGTYDNAKSCCGFTKYTGNFDGGGDGKTQLEPEDDAANILWGGGWRMPTGGTDSEFKLLETKCDRALVEEGEKIGMLFKGTGAYAGLSMFFPIVNCSSTTDGDGEHLQNSSYIIVHYLSGTVSKFDAYCYCLNIQYNPPSPSSYYFYPVSNEHRYTGCPIRPVID